VVIHYEEALYQVYAPLPLNQAKFMFYILACVMWYCCLLGPLLCIVSFHWYVCCLLVVLVKLSVLAK